VKQFYKRQPEVGAARLEDFHSNEDTGHVLVLLQFQIA
jgi:hypothetical protein